jgi:thiamine transporter ThiT
MLLIGVDVKLSFVTDSIVFSFIKSFKAWCGGVASWREMQTVMMIFQRWKWALEFCKFFFGIVHSPFGDIYFLNFGQILGTENLQKSI